MPSPHSKPAMVKSANSGTTRGTRPNASVARPQVADQHLAFDLRGHGYRVDRQDVTQVADIHRVAALLVARITHAMARRVLADGYECAEGALSNPPRDCKRP